MGHADSIKRYLGSSIFVLIGLFLILSGFILGFIPESNLFKQQYDQIISLLIIILGIVSLFYSRIYLKNQKRAVGSKPKDTTDNELED